MGVEDVEEARSVFGKHGLEEVRSIAKILIKNTLIVQHPMCWGGGR